MKRSASLDRPGRRKPRILCVDDEPQVLDALRDTLLRSFDVRVAASASAGLDQLRRDAGGFAVVMSDMRMPGMNGAAFLREACRIAPDAARILLTGYADADAAAAAVNDGQIFRYLTKPCVGEELREACGLALGHHQVLIAQRELLEQTLRGSVQALADVLAIASPMTFGRSAHVMAVIPRLADAIGFDDRWELEVAAMMAPIGTITLPEDVAEKLHVGGSMSPTEAAMVARVPTVTQAILQNIPRLEGVLQIVDNLDRRFDSVGSDGFIPIGARILRIVFDHSALLSQGFTGAVALDELRGRTGVYDGALLDIFAGVAGTDDGLSACDIGRAALEPGMMLCDDVRAASGTLLAAGGQAASAELIIRLNNLPRGFVREPLRVYALSPAR